MRPLIDLKAKLGTHMRTQQVDFNLPLALKTERLLLTNTAQPEENFFGFTLDGPRDVGEAEDSTFQ